MPDNKEAPVVISGYKKGDGPVPIFVSHDMEGEAEPVVLKFKENDVVSKGYYVNVPDGKLTTVALSNMASEIDKYYRSRGLEISEFDLKLFISALTSRIVYVPAEKIPPFISRLTYYFSGNVFYIDKLMDADYLKGCFAACRTPDRLNFFVINLQKDVQLPNFIVSYVQTPASRIQVKMEQYVNDVFINKLRLTDNIYVIATGDLEALPSSLNKYYSIWNPKVKTINKEKVEYKTISLSSLKNMHKVMNPISDDLWEKMNQIEGILARFKINLTNKDFNQLDDYLVTLVNQGVDEQTALACFVEYRLIPMVKNQISEKSLKAMLNEVGINTSGKE